MEQNQENNLPIIKISNQQEKIIPIETSSILNWPGLESKKFKGGKIHLTMKGQLDGYFGKSIPFLGCKHFPSRYGVDQKQIPHIKTFSQHNKESDLNQKFTKVNRIEHEKKETKIYERTHFMEKKSKCFEDEKFKIRPFKQANMTSTNIYFIEEKIGRKKMNETLYEKRNGMELRSLGDKPYKATDYSSNYFVQQKQGIFSLKRMYEQKKTQLNKLEKKIWINQLKKEERQIDEQSLNEVEEWEVKKRDILKDLNPNYMDNTQFFETQQEFEKGIFLDFQQSKTTKQDQKDSKKAIKK